LAFSSSAGVCARAKAALALSTTVCKSFIRNQIL
jgi:hypothetical protein